MTFNVRPVLRVALLAAFSLTSACGGAGGTTPPAGTVPGIAASGGTSAPATTGGASSNALAPGALAAPNISLNITPAMASQSDVSVTALSVSGNASPPPIVSDFYHISPALSASQLTPTSLSVDRRGVPITWASRRPLYSVANPDDLIYSGGPVLSTVVSHNIYISTDYLSCGSTCWGNPPYGTSIFETQVAGSGFIHYIDQYIGLYTSNRYTLGSSYTATVHVFSSNPGSGAYPIVSMDDILYIVYLAGLSSGGGGYGNVFHVFLPPQTDTCFDFSATCYSPDKVSTFKFCAYHGSVNYGSGYKYLFTVQPYQDVLGCQSIGINKSSSTSDLIDSTANSVAHELVETITDPDGNAWYDDDGNEVGDHCNDFKTNTSIPPYLYYVQYLYSNVDHACIGG